MQSIITRKMAREILEVNENSSIKEINIAYLKKVKENHPDKYLDKDEKEIRTEMLKLINAARELLIGDIEHKTNINKIKPYKEDIIELGKKIDKYGTLINKTIKIAEDINQIYNSLFINKIKGYLGTIKEEEIKGWIRKNYNIINKIYNKYEWKEINNEIIGIGIENFNNKIKIRLNKNIKDFEPIEEGILIGEGRIPNLYIFTGYTARTWMTDYIDQKPYLYIFDALKKMYMGIDNEEILKFIKKNKTKIDSIMAEYFKSGPHYLGGGRDGVAYDIGSGKVFKMFKDTYAYEKSGIAKERMDYKDSGKTEARIYDLGQFKDLEEGPVYYYIIEKMRAFTLLGEDIDIRRAIGKIIDMVEKDMGATLGEWTNEYWWNIKEKASNFMDKDKEEMSQINKIVKEHAKKLKNLIDKNDKRFLEKKLKLSNGWEKLFIEEIMMKLLTGRSDVNTSNLGVSTSSGYAYLRFFDPAAGAKDDNGVNQSAKTA